jgi:hypothetical protein
MVSTKIKVVVELKVMSNEPLTDNDKVQVVSDMDYSFDFAEMLNENFTTIIDTEILDVVEE